MSEEMNAPERPVVGAGPPVLETPPEWIEVTVPARAVMWPIARFAAAKIAQELEFDLPRVHDVQMAVGELCTLCASGAGPSSTLTLRVTWDGSALWVLCEAIEVTDDLTAQEDSDLPPGFMPGELSHRILEAIVDEYSVWESDRNVRQGWLKKAK